MARRWRRSLERAGTPGGAREGRRRPPAAKMGGEPSEATGATGSNQTPSRTQPDSEAIRSSTWSSKRKRRRTVSKCAHSSCRPRCEGTAITLCAEPGRPASTRAERTCMHALNAARVISAVWGGDEEGGPCAAAASEPSAGGPRAWRRESLPTHECQGAGVGGDDVRKEARALLARMLRRRVDVVVVDAVCEAREDHAAPRDPRGERRERKVLNSGWKPRQQHDGGVAPHRIDRAR